jgi:hypothetical protein
VFGFGLDGDAFGSVLPALVTITLFIGDCSVHVGGLCYGGLGLLAELLGE